jgi:hypothetical protein
MDDLAGAMHYLDDNGYVVIRGVASEEEISKGQDLAWRFIEKLCPDVKRGLPNSWNSSHWPDPYGNGIIPSDGVGQSEFLWFCRGIKNVQAIFQTVWQVDNLITSFDGFCFHRAFEYNQAWKTADTAWYHTDQNGCRNPERICVQGFLNFFESGLNDGGLIVVPGSHKLFKQIFEARRQTLQGIGDYIPFSKDSSLWNGEIKTSGLAPRKVCCGPGDFVLWDSRTIHCNEFARTSRSFPEDGSILSPRRIVAYICMTPASRLTRLGRAYRIGAYLNGDTTSHWPEALFTPSVRRNMDQKKYQPVELSDDQKKLIPLENLL